MWIHPQKAQQKSISLYDEYCLIYLDNLNEVKLGNFPEIDVYVIVSCHNNSLFSVKDFHKLAIAPIDLEIAF